MSQAAGAKPLLFTPIELRDLKLRNRVVISPMVQCSAGPDGVAGDWHMVHLGRFAIGGAALIFTEAIAVEACGRYSYGDLGLWTDEQVRPLERITGFIKTLGAVPGVQLWHAGRKASSRRPWNGGAPLDESDAARGEPPWQVVAPSAIPVAPGDRTPRDLSLLEIGELQDAWRAATRRAAKAGFEVIEIHGAHGYLVHQFLSALSNQRADRYGGNLRGRMRFALEIAEIVRAEWPADKPVFFRISVEDENDPSWGLEEAVALAGELKNLGIDVIDCSSGGIGTSGFAIKGRRIPGYQVGLAGELRRRAELRTMGVGLITRAAQAEQYLQNELCDLVAIAREALYDPHWAAHAARELGADPDFRLWPIQHGWWLDYRAKTVVPDAEITDDLGK